ncbi:MAG: hypothetical protein V2I36_19405 [Desulfopila sp.]|jgi:hypothetical protein|nr:hypothetical protein [Desulfopila sp.]
MHKYAGWIIFGTLIFYLVSLLFSPFLYLAAAAAWLVPGILWRSLPSSTRKQALFLLISGVLTLLFAAVKGVFLGWHSIVAGNLPLLAMFVAVSFLTLTTPEKEDPLLPAGRRAVLATALGTHLIGGVINLSVLLVFGDRLRRRGGLSNEQMIVLARSFCAAAWWSPFFIATGVALIYAPEMHWQETVVPGLIMSGIAIVYLSVEVSYVRKGEFSGYPLKWESLVVPLFLAIVVLCSHALLPDTGILVLICMISPLGAVMFMKGRPRAAALLDFITTRIVTVTSQFALFLAAGVFSMGIKSVTHVYPELFVMSSPVFSPLLFAGVGAAMIIVGVLGVHPVISIAVVSPLLLPLQPDHSQLGFLFLTSWAVSTACSPLSGVGLTLVSRYHAKPRQILVSNWHYAAAMWAIASFVNILFFH